MPENNSFPASQPKNSAGSKTQEIRLLSPDVREKIAAGEVIERPASVVKELVENSLDAGATEIAVILEQGGKALIEVLDNGAGMSKENLALSVRRHATSKLRSLEDLERLYSLGFRGEALPSVAAVSHLNLISRPKDHSQAFELDIENSVEVSEASALKPVTFGHFLGSPHGTRIRVTGLFSQIPARLKFLRSQAAEVSQVREWLERLALTQPHVGFRLVSNDRTLFQLRPQTQAERVKAILSDGNDYPVIEAENSLGLTKAPEVRVKAFWLQGMSTPKMRKLIQVVNSRAVRDKLIQQAILSPFRQALLPGQFPAVCVFVEIDPSKIDVNAHPAKTEIRFLNSREVFHAVETLIASMIASHGASGFAPSRPEARKHGNWRASQSAFSAPGLSFGTRASSASSSSFKASQPYEASEGGWSFSTSAPTLPSETRPETTSETESEPKEQEGRINSAAHPFLFGRYVGSVFNTYLLYDLGAELGLIDQHAAHERIRFEALKKRAFDENEGNRNSQALLIPEPIKFRSDERIEIEKRLEWLERLGFEAEVFGEETLLFRGIPSEWGTESLKIRLQSLVERLLAVEAPEGEKSSESLPWDETLFEKIASEACHSAIRAGDRLDAFEAGKLAEELFRCEHPWNCPHGRPTTVKVPKGRFEEWFQRRV